MKKILIVTPALSLGGMQRSSSNIANGLNSKGCDVTLLTVLKQNKFFTLDAGVKLLEPIGFNHKSLALFKTIFWLRGELKKGKYDSVLVFGKIYGAITALSSIFLPINFLVSERSSPYYKWPYNIRIISYLAFKLKSPNVVISQTVLASKIQKKYYSNKSKIIVIPNPVREIKLEPDLAREKTILGIGRLGEYIKGFDQLIKAFSMIESDWNLVLAGPTNNAENIFKLVNDLEIAHKVIFLSVVENIDNLLAKTGIFVMPSRSEGFPNALLEAMASGTTCVSFDFVAGPRDIIKQNKNGILVPEGNIDSLAKTIQKLINDKEKRIKLGEIALETRIKYSFSNIIDKFFDACFKI